VTVTVKPRGALVGERARQSLPAKIIDLTAITNVAVLVATSTSRKAS